MIFLSLALQNNQLPPTLCFQKRGLGMSKTEEIAQLLAQGKSLKEIISMGYKKGTVYSVQRKYRKGRIITTERINNKNRTFPKHTPANINLDIEIESDPEIFRLKKEIRKVELEKQLSRIKIPPDVEIIMAAAHEIGRVRQECCDNFEDDLCTWWIWDTAEEIPKCLGEPVFSEENKEWRIKPSPLYCAMCTASIQNELYNLEDRFNSTPTFDIRKKFSCDCGAKGMVAVSIKCTKCNKETWMGWWSNKQYSALPNQ